MGNLVFPNRFPGCRANSAYWLILSTEEIVLLGSILPLTIRRGIVYAYCQSKNTSK